MSSATALLAWANALRARGVKAAHPDDGWVNRERNRIHLCYPQFDDGLAVGDLLALGWPDAPTRIVRVIGWEEPPICLGMRYWFFEPVS